MPEETRSFIEGECLRVARLQPGCKHLKAIAIARTHNGRTNWEVLGFNPELSSAVRAVPDAGPRMSEPANLSRRARRAPVASTFRHSAGAHAGWAGVGARPPRSSLSSRRSYFQVRFFYTLR